MEINTRQVGAVIEGPQPNIGETFSYGHVCQTSAGSKRAVSINLAFKSVLDVRDAVGYCKPCKARAKRERLAGDISDLITDGDAGKLGAVVERRWSEGGDAIRHEVITQDLGLRVEDERGLAFVKQHPIQAAIGTVLPIDVYRTQTGSATKRTKVGTNVDADSARRDIYLHKIGAARERASSNPTDALTNCHVGEADARAERIPPYVSHAIRYDDAG